MACLQSFDPLVGGLPPAKNSSGSLSKDDKTRRHQEPVGGPEGNGDMLDCEPAYPCSQQWLLVEQHGSSRHRTFVATGERYEMVRLLGWPLTSLSVRRYVHCV